jgi:hypothetical protein
MFYYNTTDVKFRFYNGSAWGPIDTSGGFNYWGQIDGDSGNTTPATAPDNLAINGGTGISTTITAQTVTINGDDAAADGSTKGVATFTAADFSAASGVISLADTVVKSVTTDSGALTPSSHSFSLLGGEGIDVTHTGTTITVAGEDATITNKGVASFATADFTVSSGAVSLQTDVVRADGSVAFTAVQTGVTPTGSSHLATKGYVDSAIAGLSWRAPVDGLEYLGTRTITQINALSPSAGDTVVAGDAGTPTAGTSDALVAGDIAEYDGANWKKTVSHSSNYPPAGTRLLVSAGTLFTPLTDASDENKIATFSGSSLTPALQIPTDGWATLNRNASSINYNKAYVYESDTPEWIHFGGASADHNSLAGLQGGTTDEYYHLTSAQHTALTGEVMTFFANTDMTGAQAETLSDGSDASTLHIHDARYYTETELDAGQLDNRYFTETELGATASGSEGATLIGTADLSNLGAPANVQLALEALDGRFKTNAGNPNADTIAGVAGAFCLDTTNDIAYVNVDGTTTGWMVI